MLGRLRISTDEALKAYSTIAGAIFSPENKKWRTQDGMFKATTLENHIKRVVSQKLHGERIKQERTSNENGEDLMLDPSQTPGNTKSLCLCNAGGQYGTSSSLPFLQCP